MVECCQSRWTDDVVGLVDRVQNCKESQAPPPRNGGLCLCRPILTAATSRTRHRVPIPCATAAGQLDSVHLTCQTTDTSLETTVRLRIPEGRRWSCTKGQSRAVSEVGVGTTFTRRIGSHQPHTKE